MFKNLREAACFIQDAWGASARTEGTAMIEFPVEWHRIPRSAENPELYQARFRSHDPSVFLFCTRPTLEEALNDMKDVMMANMSIAGRKEFA